MNTDSLPWRSLLLAPLVSIPAAALSALGSSDAGVASDFFWGLFFGVTLAVPACYLGIALVGLPVYLLLRQFNLLQPWILSAIGFLVPLALFAGAAPFRTTLMAVSSGLAVSIAAYLLLPRTAKSSLAESTGKDA
jgi:hypothetical protein